LREGRSGAILSPPRPPRDPDGEGRRGYPISITATSPAARAPFGTATLAPGVRLHVLASDRFTTSVCRVAFHRDLGAEATATSLLGNVMEAATERHPTREALAHRLADLYGAGLSVGTEKLGDRQVLSATLDWPTAGVAAADGRRGGTLGEGLAFLREVLTEPKRGRDGLDPETVATEAKNLVRSLRSLRDDKGRYALRRCLESACEGEPFALDAEGREEDVAGATPGVLAALHARLLATAPVEIFLASALRPAEAKAAVRRHLLWTDRARSPRPVPPAASVRAPRRRPRRIVEQDAVVQGKLAMAFRAPIAPDSPLLPAAMTLSGVLGGTSVSRLFKVVRETHGLCYYANAGWVRAKGLMLVTSGVEPKDEPRATRLVLRLFREVAAGRLDAKAWEAYRQAARARVEAMQDDRGAAIGYAQEMTALGLSPDPTTHLRALEAVKPADVRRAAKALALDTVFFLTSRAAAGEGA
jgi:predicted Zn-dependent peptidase